MARAVARGRGERSAVLRGVVGAVALLELAGTAYAGAGRTIEETESLRVAAFWLVFIILSLMVEKMFHYSEHSLEHAGKKGYEPCPPPFFSPGRTSPVAAHVRAPERLPRTAIGSLTPRCIAQYPGSGQ